MFKSTESSVWRFPSDIDGIDLSFKGGYDGELLQLRQICVWISYSEASIAQTCEILESCLVKHEDTEADDDGMKQTGKSARISSFVLWRLLSGKDRSDSTTENSIDSNVEMASIH